MGGYKSVQDYFRVAECSHQSVRVQLEEYLNGVLPYFPVLPSICDTKVVPWFECGVQEMDLRIMIEGREKELRRKTCHFF